MGLDSRLNKDIKENEKQRIFRNTDESDDLDGTEQTLTYMHRKPAAFINEGNGVFDIKKQTGINTQKSVFDRSAIFKTDEGDY